MSILVPNSFFILNTIPESCYLCPFKHNGCELLEKYKDEHNGCIPPYHYTDRHLWNPEDKGRVHGCPLVPVPPHGRLIDADALMNNIANRIYIRIATGETNPADWCITGDVIAKAPTVIEAEEANGCD